MAECWQEEWGDVGAKAQERDQRHTLDLQVPSPVPEPPATGPATGGSGAGDTVHLERARPGRDRLVLRRQRGPASRARAAGCERGAAGAAGQLGTAPALSRRTGHFSTPKGGLPSQLKGDSPAVPLGEDSAGPGPGPPHALSLPALPPSALLRALGGLHHGVAPLAHGQLPAEEGRGALRLHPPDLLTCLE